MGLSETDEKVVKKGVLDAFCSVFVEKNLLWLSIAVDWFAGF